MKDFIQVNIISRQILRKNVQALQSRKQASPPDSLNSLSSPKNEMFRHLKRLMTAIGSISLKDSYKKKGKKKFEQVSSPVFKDDFQCL